MTVLEKSIELLNMFLDGKAELSLDDITRHTGMNKTTARRIALSLIRCGFLRQQHPRGKYSLGMRFLNFSQALKHEIPLVDIADPFLSEFGRITDETVSMAVWDGQSAAICLVYHPSHPLKVLSYEGTMLGLNFNSLGKAILADLTPAEVKKHTEGPLIQYTPNTITDYDELMEHLETVRKNGIAIDDEESFEGIRGIAATIKNNQKTTVGAITILGPSVRLTRGKIRTLIPLVKECAANISRSLGY